MRDFIKQIFTDTQGNFSSKRTVTISSFLLLSIAFVANLFWDLDIAEFMFDNFMYIVVAGLGFATAEPLANSLLGRDSKKKSPPDATE